MKFKGILYLILLIIPILLTSNVYSWYDPNWEYRIPITIQENSGNDLYDYQVMLTVNTYDLIFAGKMNPDCSDIRFTYLYPNGTEVEIPYWMEYCADRYYEFSVEAYYGSGTICVSDMNNFPDTPNSYGSNDWHTWDPWSCDNCDWYVRIYLNFTGDLPKEVLLEVKSDDGQTVWINGNTVGSAGGGCHAGGTASRVWNLTNYIQYNNEIRIWCSEATGGEVCNFRLFVDGQEIRFNGDYSYPNSIIWIKVPYIPANGNITVYMYYGNPDAVSMSNKDNVMIKWTGSYQKTCSSSTSGGTCSVTFYPSDIGYSDYIFYDVVVNLEMAGDLDAGGAVAVDNVCTPDSESNERIIVYYNSICVGYYSTGYQDCNLRTPAGWPKTFYVNNSTLTFLSDATNEVNSNPGCGYFFFTRYTLLEAYLRKYTSPEPSFTLGTEQLNIIYEVVLPINNTVYTTNEIPVNITLVSSENITVQRVEVIVNGSVTHFWENVYTNTSLTTTIYLEDGIYELTFNAVINDKDVPYEDTIIIYVDTIPPNVNIVYPEPITYLLKPDNRTIPIYVVASDLTMLKNCTIILWNNTELDRCNEILYLDVYDLPEGAYTITAIAYDIADHYTVRSTTFIIEYPEGNITFYEVYYPSNVPAVPFNITATIQCLNDWCVDVVSEISIPPECSLSTPRTVFIGDMGPYELRNATWTISCRKAENYTFVINASTGLGYNITYEFTLEGPKLSIYINPYPHPLDTEDIYFIVNPSGYGRPITIEYHIIRQTIGERTELISEGTVTIPDNVNSTVYILTSDKTSAADKIIFNVRIIDPLEFYEIQSTSVIVYDNIPPSILNITLKYPNIAPHDGLQEVLFTVEDTMITKVELYVDFGNGSFVLYDSKTYYLGRVTDSFSINHTEYIDNIISLYIIAYDYFNNTAVSNILSYLVSENKPPTITITQPANESVLNTTEVILGYRVTDDFSNNIVCRINGKTINTTSGKLNAEVITLREGTNIITILCSDEQGHEARTSLVLYVDTIPPAINKVSYNTTDSNITFNILVSDNFNLSKIQITYVIDDNVVEEDIFDITGTEYNLVFSKSFDKFANNLVYVTISVYDKAGNSVSYPPITFFVQKIVTELGPIYYIKLPPEIELLSYEQIDNTVVLKYIVKSTHATVSCKLFYNSNSIDIGLVSTNIEQTYNITLPPGKYNMFMVCTDPEGLSGVSNTLTVEIKPTIPIERITEITARAIAFKESTLSFPVALGITTIIFGIMLGKYILIALGTSIVIAGPLMVYGIITNDPGLLTTGIILSIIITIIARFILNRISHIL